MDLTSIEVEQCWNELYDMHGNTDQPLKVKTQIESTRAMLSDLVIAFVCRLVLNL